MKSFFCEVVANFSEPHQSWVCIAILAVPSVTAFVSRTWIGHVQPDMGNYLFHICDAYICANYTATKSETISISDAKEWSSGNL